ncbi:alcohol dehydrogenase [Scheffersomyces xylosifermentans]|uniref:alcohol dehydrogenase n=1 Tax=Scheffersomyces xylosifermentans TaxID=1304137 RepID=UPI00315C9CA9
METVGLCHTDLSMGVGGAITDVPKILGHEGTGKVLKIGSKVTHVAVGDPVILSFTWCGDCSPCKSGAPGYCYEFPQGNFIMNDLDETYVLDGQKIDGKFFGQSSFAKIGIVNGPSVVNVKHLNLDADTLAKFGPLGCGFLTGAGAITNAGEAKKDESCVIYGLGGVGFAAIMAAKIAGCNPIIGVDINEKKFDLAKKLGATHVIKGGDDAEVSKQIKELTGGHGAELSLECIGGSRFVQNAVDNACHLGKIVYVGLAGMEDVISIPSFPFMIGGKKLIGCTEGNARPYEFIEKMIGWHAKGQFPIEELQKTYKIEDFQLAVDDMKKGNVIKPILKY